MTNVSASDRHLTIGGTTKALRHQIEDYLVHDGTILVLLDVPGGEVDNTNVIAFDGHGNRLWEIEESPHGPQTDKPFMSISEEDDTVLVENWNGMVYELDTDTGQIEPNELRRM